MESAVSKTIIFCYHGGRLESHTACHEDLELSQATLQDDYRRPHEVRGEADRFPGPPDQCKEFQLLKALNPSVSKSKTLQLHIETEKYSKFESSSSESVNS